MTINVLSMYTREVYQAIEAYAKNPTNRYLYDEILEAVTERANEIIAQKEAK